MSYLQGSMDWAFFPLVVTASFHLLALLKYQADLWSLSENLLNFKHGGSRGCQLCSKRTWTLCKGKNNAQLDSDTMCRNLVSLFLLFFFFLILTSQLDNGVSRVIFAFLCCTNSLEVNRTGRLIEKCLCFSSFFS